MFDLDNINEIWQTIARNKTRSLLTAFGVFWGIFILVILLASGNGFQNGLNSQIEGFATNSAFVIPVQTTEAYKGYQKGRSWETDMSDIQAIKKKIKGVGGEISLWQIDVYPLCSRRERRGRRTLSAVGRHDR